MRTRRSRPTLVDTSAWVEFLRATGSPVDRAVTAALADGSALWITGVILQEVLQGMRTGAQLTDMRAVLSGCVQAEPVFPETYDHAAALYRRCRDAGRTVRGTVDCLIAAIAIENGLSVLGNDRDLATLHAVCGLAVESP